MKKPIVIISLLVFASLLTMTARPSSAADEAPRIIKLGVGFDLSVGDYGGREASDIVQVPVSASYERGPLRLKLVIPYRQVIGPGNVVPAGVNAIPVVGRRPGERRENSGLGDIVAGASYNVMYLPERPLLLSLAMNFKFPTADESKGLGTGETDYSLQADALTALNDLSLFGAIGYESFGSPDAFTLKNAIFMRAGGAYPYARESAAGLILEWRQAASPGVPSPLETTVFVRQRLSPVLDLYGYILKGWSKGSPDLGFGVSISRRM
ncbi:MAG: hypothetical protein QY316_01030 [Thermodesulfobacteriota bacterium]|nr:MAG: hypothetical protein QY316_01030 [Thermodesulfobacteriota bacterium]